MAKVQIQMKPVNPVVRLVQKQKSCLACQKHPNVHNITYNASHKPYTHARARIVENRPGALVLGSSETCSDLSMDATLSW